MNRAQRAYCQKCCEEGKSHKHFPLVYCFDILARENQKWSKVNERMQTIYTQATPRYQKFANVIGYLESGIANKKVTSDYQELTSLRNEMI